jgi:membrane-associated phospholipid phosphatase
MFIAAATLVSLGRVFVGAHYPADVLAGTLVGLGAALFVVRVGGPVIEWAVRQVEKVTDPVAGVLWRQRFRRTPV